MGLGGLFGAHDAEKIGSTGSTLTLHGLSAILHGYLLAVLHLSLLTTLYAICFHVIKISANSMILPVLLDLVRITLDPYSLGRKELGTIDYCLSLPDNLANCHKPVNILQLACSTPP